MSQEVKYLDLDAIAPKVAFKIRLDGEDHFMKEMSVEDFVWATNEAQKQLDNYDNMTPKEMVESMIAVLSRQFPTVKEKQFKDMGLEKMRRLMEFTRELAAEGAEETIAKAADEGKVEMGATTEMLEAQ